MVSLLSDFIPSTYIIMMSHTRLCLANMVTFLWRYDLDPFFVTVIHPLRPRLVPSRSNTLGKTVHRSGFKRFYLYSLHVSENGRLVVVIFSWDEFTSVSVSVKHLKCFPEWLFPYQTDLVDEVCPAKIFPLLWYKELHPFGRMSWEKRGKDANACTCCTLYCCQFPTKVSIHLVCLR